MAKKRWVYSAAGICRAGSMLCATCRQKIVDGLFRYRETEEAFISQHKACSRDDPEWDRIDQRRREHQAFFDRRKAALQVFVNEYGAPDEDLIDECMAMRSPQVSSKEL